MATFIALLRGINVGKANRLPMADLRALLNELGHTQVATLLNSGNAVFHVGQGSPARHAAAISEAIAAKFGFDIHVIVKSANELDAIVADNPIDTASADHSQVLVAFVQDAASLESLRPMASLAVPPEQLLFGKKAAYLHCAKGILDSKVATALVGKAGKVATSRNWATVLKLQALASPPCPGGTPPAIPLKRGARSTPSG